MRDISSNAVWWLTVVGIAPWILILLWALMR